MAPAPASDPASRLTIVIPTFRRPDKALRALRFWAGRGFRVLMLDGSAVAMPLPETVAADPGITYLHRPEPLSQRLGHAARTVSTPYACLCGDDDFMLPAALRASLGFLDAHPAYVACGGQALGFDKGPLGGLRAFVRYPQFRDLDIAHLTARDRTAAHFGQYSPATVYAVCRSKPWAEAMTLWADREFPVYAIGEIQFEFHMASSGAIRRLPVLHWLRSHEVVKRAHQRAGNGDASLSTALTLPELWHGNAHAALCQEVVTFTANRIAALSGRPDAEVDADLRAALNACLHPPAPHASALARLRQKLVKRLRRWRLPFRLRLWLLRRRAVTCDPADMAAIAHLLAAPK